MTEAQIRLLKSAISGNNCDGGESASDKTRRRIVSDLKFIFFDRIRLLESALTLVDNGLVKEIYCPQLSRQLWIVVGSKGNNYLCLRNYCSCPSFLEHAKNSAENILVLLEVGFQIISHLTLVEILILSANICLRS